MKEIDNNNEGLKHQISRDIFLMYVLTPKKLAVGAIIADWLWLAQGSQLRRLT